MTEAKLNTDITVLESERQDCKYHRISDPAFTSYVLKAIPYKPNSKNSSVE